MPTSVARSHSDYTTYTSTYKPLDKSLSGSNTSLSSVRSAREPLNHYTSLTGGSHGNGISVLELEKSKSKVRKLERQVNTLKVLYSVYFLDMLLSLGHIDVQSKGINKHAVTLIFGM